MTILHEPVWSAVGGPDAQAVVFKSFSVRETFDGTGVITKRPIRVYPEDNELTTPDLDPGLTEVTIGFETRVIEIPDSTPDLRFWPLWDAAAPVVAEPEEGFVRNGGGIRRAQKMTATAYAALGTYDPETFYAIIAG